MHFCEYNNNIAQGQWNSRKRNRGAYNAKSGFFIFLGGPSKRKKKRGGRGEKKKLYTLSLSPKNSTRRFAHANIYIRGMRARFICKPQQQQRVIIHTHISSSSFFIIIKTTIKICLIFYAEQKRVYIKY